MMRYLETGSTDPAYNLAFEQYAFDSLSREHSYFMLWQNANSVIVGKHQNTAAEVNAAYVTEHNVSVVRRLSGGGAVYHDMGNLNFTFIVDGGAKSNPAFDFASFCRPVAAALAELGVAAEISGRNDMTIDGKKFSGNAQYHKQGRTMHHGTLLFDSDLSVVAKVLEPPKDKIESKGIASVRSRVTNIRPYLREDMPIQRFWAALRGCFARETGMEPYSLGERELAAIRGLQEETYSRWAWNYGASPDYRVQKARRVEGCGRIELAIDVEKSGTIRDIAFHGDYFGSRDASELAGALRGKQLEGDALRGALAGMAIGDFFHNLSMEELVSILIG
jgi:lipoate-protein ligase A